MQSDDNNSNELFGQLSWNKKLIEDIIFTYDDDRLPRRMQSDDKNLNEPLGQLSSNKKVHRRRHNLLHNTKYMSLIVLHMIQSGNRNKYRYEYFPYRSIIYWIKPGVNSHFSEVCFHPVWQISRFKPNNETFLYRYIDIYTVFSYKICLNSI